MANSSVFETIKRRRSVRRYQSRPIEEEKILTLLEAARLAPSSSNTQPWHFIVVRNPETIRKIRDCVPAGSKPLLNDFIKTAPTIIVACGKPHPINHIFT
ncbi:MAG: nitroreductase family protein, partial [candidate division WOR-3 bacterium]